MSWLKGFLAYILAALRTVAETSGVYVVTGWLKQLSLPGAPTWMKTPLGWVGKILLALWRSFWSVWGNPMTYPIIGAVAFGMFLVGHHEGHRPVASAEAISYAATRERDAAVAAAKKAAGDLAAARSRVAELEARQPVAAPAAAPALRPHKTRTVKAAPAKASGTPWGLPW